MTQFYHSNTSQIGVMCAYFELQVSKTSASKLLTVNQWKIITGDRLIASRTRGPDFTGSLRHLCVSNDEVSVTGTGGRGSEKWVRDGETKYGERKRKEWVWEGGGGVLPPRRHSITEEKQQQRYVDDERSILSSPSLQEKKEKKKAALLKYWKRFIIKHNQCGILRRYTAGEQAESHRGELGRKQADSSGPRTATMAPMVEEGAQIGESN